MKNQRKLTSKYMDSITKSILFRAFPINSLISSVQDRCSATSQYSFPNRIAKKAAKINFSWPNYKSLFVTIEKHFVKWLIFVLILLHT
jgi:hypothetical protein